MTGWSLIRTSKCRCGPVGAPIYAAAKGTVSFAGIRQGYGNCIEISHGNGVLTRYAHMSAFRAHVGQTVAAQDLCSSIRPYMKSHHLQAGVGHYGVFSGRKWNQQIYPRVRDVIHGADD